MNEVVSRGERDVSVEVEGRSVSAEKARILAAVVDTLLPAAPGRPGGVAAGVVRFLDRELAASLRGRLSLYQQALTELDEMAQRVAGTRFADLTLADRSEILGTIEQGSAPEAAALKPWFETILADTIDGFLSDPFYGGNVDRIGWRHVGYPGPSLTWAPEEQELDRVVPEHGATVLELVAPPAAHVTVRDIDA